MADQTPRLVVEPPIPVTTEFSTVDHVRSVITRLDAGNFREPALLAERMLFNPRLRAVLETRLNGLLASKVRFEPSRNNRDARRAAREYAEDFPTMASSPARKQFAKWALLLGVSFAQRALAESTASGRHLFRLRPYWPGFAIWYWAHRAYRIQTFDKGVIETPSPSLDSLPSAAASPWMVAEPFGINSYREGLIHAAWRPWLGHDWALRDQARASEKHGIGIIKAKYPRGSGEEHRAAITKYLSALRSMGSEGIIPCEQRDDGAPGFDAEPFEFNGGGFDAIDRTAATCAVALAILFLGHNLTTEVKSGGSYAAAGVGEYIRDDIKNHDASVEDATLHPQFARPYCELNYSDPCLAPLAIYETDSTSVNQAQAQMYAALSQAVSLLRKYAPNVDVDALCERFRLPLLKLEGTLVTTGQSPQETPADEAQEPAEPQPAPQEAA